MFFMLLTAVVQGTIVMGTIEMRKIDLLACLFIPGSLPNLTLVPPSPPTHTLTKLTKVSRSRKEGGALGK